MENIEGVSHRLLVALATLRSFSHPVSGTSQPHDGLSRLLAVSLYLLSVQHSRFVQRIVAGFALSYPFWGGATFPLESRMRSGHLIRSMLIWVRCTTPRPLCTLGQLPHITTPQREPNESATHILPSRLFSNHGSRTRAGKNRAHASEKKRYQLVCHGWNVLCLYRD